MILLRATHLEWALRKSGMPTKGAQTSMEAYFHGELVNQGILQYTKMLSEGQAPTFLHILALPPPPGFEVLEPDNAGLPRRWGKQTPTSTSQPASLSTTEREPILKMAATAASPVDCVAGDGNTEGDTEGATLLAYRWNLKSNTLSTNKSSKLNLYPPSCGIKPAWVMIQEAKDLLRLHQLKLL